MQYAYEQDGTDLFPPTCSPSFSNCKVYEFADVWALSTTPPATDPDGHPVEPAGDTPDGSLVDHGFDYNLSRTTAGTFLLTFGSVTWAGTYSGTFRGSKAGTGKFALVGTDGSYLTGTIAFLGDGVAQLTGTIT